MKKWFILFSVVVAVGFGALTAVAKEQGSAIQVDSDNACNQKGSSDRQDNKILPGLASFVWFNLSESPGTYRWELSDKGKVICTCDDSINWDCFGPFSQCAAPEEQWWSSVVDPSEFGTPTPSGTCNPTGSVVLTVFEGDKNLGSDGFRITLD
jgi:hypothetical protein